jgi:cobalt/nickel transport system ATP-binding protein
MIDVRNLTYRYQDKIPILKGINFFIGQGEFVVIFGKNGSGKTTLMKCISGLLHPESGDVFVDSVSISCLKKNGVLHKKLGFVFQSPDEQLFAHTVREEASFGLINLGFSDKEVDLRVNNALHEWGLEDLADRDTHVLSCSERKRLCLASIFAMKQKILLLDDPTVFLDTEAEADTLAILARMNTRDGVTILMTTYRMASIPRSVHRVYILKDGRLFEMESDSILT